MMRRLPTHHAFRNLGRRPLRSALMVLAGALVTALLVATSAFVRSLESSHLGSAPKNTALLISTSAEGDILRSSMSPAVADLAAADAPGITRVGDVPAASPEIHMGTALTFAGESETHAAFIRGVTPRAFLVHEALTLVAGHMPGPGEALVGRLAASKCGVDPQRLGVGRTFDVEGGTFTISGLFAAPGTTLESEIWVGLSEIQGLSRREDCSCVFVRVENDSDLPDVALFAQRRLDLELTSLSAKVYYAELAAYFQPILALAWSMAVLIGLAASAGGANAVMASVQDRVRELGVLRAIGFKGPALAWSIFLEVLTLAAAGALLGLWACRLLLGSVSINMAMTAFRLEVDPVSILMGLFGLFLITTAGAIPALVRILRLPVARALKET